jgi:hypothetical protein
MDFSRLTSRAKEMFARRGGTEAAKQDAQELKDIARSDASLGDKAKAGVEALKEPGAPGGEPSPGGTEPSPGGTEPSPGGTEPSPGGEERPPAAEERKPGP